MQTVANKAAVESSPTAAVDYSYQRQANIARSLELALQHSPSLSNEDIIIRAARFYKYLNEGA